MISPGSCDYNDTYIIVKVRIATVYNNDKKQNK